MISRGGFDFSKKFGEDEMPAGAAPDAAAPLEPAITHPPLVNALAAKLERVSEKAIDKLDELLALPLDDNDPNFGNLLRAQNAAANTALGAKIKVDEFALQSPRRNGDVLARLLETIKIAEARKRARLAAEPHHDRP